MTDFDFTQLKGRMAQAGKGGHVELSDLERNALISNAMDGGGGSVDPEEVQELIDESLEGYYNKFEVDSELNTKSDKSDTYTKTEVDETLATLEGGTAKVVSSLPTASADTQGDIYYVTSSFGNSLMGYVTVQSGSNYSWANVVNYNFSNVGNGYACKGVATISTSPDTTTSNVFYILGEVGTYVNMNSIVHASGIGIALWNGTAWSYQNVPSSAVVLTDATPTENSTNPVQSGGVYDALCLTDAVTTILSQTTSPKKSIAIPTLSVGNTYYLEFDMSAEKTFDITLRSASGSGGAITQTIASSRAWSAGHHIVSFVFSSGSYIRIGESGQWSSISNIYLKDNLESLAANVVDIDKKVDAYDAFLQGSAIDLDNGESVTLVDNKYIVFSNGGVNSSTNWKYYKIENNSHLGIRARCGMDGGLPAAIAFYDDGAINSTHFISGVQGEVFVTDYYARVPDNCKYIVVCTKKDIIATPDIYLYKIDFPEQPTINTILAQRNAAALDTGSIITNINTSSLPNGTKIRILIDAVGGSSNAVFSLYNGSQVYMQSKPVSAGDLFEVEKTAVLSKIQMYKSSASSNVFNYTIYIVKDSTFDIDFPIYNGYQLSDEENYNSIELKNPFRGYYSITDYGKITITAQWVSWQKEYSCGYILTISADWTTYVVQINTASLGGQPIIYGSKLLSSDTTFDFTGVLFWNLQIRRIDYAAITPDDVANAISLTFVSGKKIVRPASLNALCDLKDELQSLKGVGSKEYYRDIFAGSPYYYHFSANSFLKDGNGNKMIASESLDDILVAARLGFSFIEANIHRTSDGKYICIHGSSGTFSTEIKSINTSVISTADAQSTAINSVTLDWIKTNLRYDSYYTKYQTTIPSLEEFCECCRVNNIGIFAGVGTVPAANLEEVIAICKKYLGNNVILYGAPSSVRDNFNGYCFTWENYETYTLNNLKSKANSYGSPYIMGIGPSLLESLKNNDDLDTLIQWLHDNNYLAAIANVYQTEVEARDAFKSGVDVGGAGHEVNPFSANYENIDLDGSASQFTTTGTISNNVATLANGDTLSFASDDEVSLGKGMLTLRFNGSLSIAFGSVSHSAESDGSEDIVISDYFLKRATHCTITASSSATITKLLYRTSKC